MPVLNTVLNSRDDDTVKQSNLSPKNPNKLTALPSWIQHNTRITVKLPNTLSFTKEFLHKLDDTSWTITLSRSRKITNITHTSNEKFLELLNNGSLC